MNTLKQRFLTVENAAKTLITLILTLTNLCMYTVFRVNTTAPCCHKAHRQARSVTSPPFPSYPRSSWNTNLRPVCLVSLIISFRASSALSFVSLTKETGFCRPCFSNSSDTLQAESQRSWVLHNSTTTAAAAGVLNSLKQCTANANSRHKISNSID